MFARKFDLQDPSSVELLNTIDEMREKSDLHRRNTTIVDFHSLVMLQQQFVDIENNSYLEQRCLSMANNDTSLVRLELCDASSENQWFEIGTQLEFFLIFY